MSSFVDSSEGLGSPIDVAHVEDRAVGTVDLPVGALKLDADGGEAQVGAHGEVGNGCDQGDGGGDVVEDAVGARFGECESPEDEGRDKHDCSDGLSLVSCESPGGLSVEITYKVPI